MVKIPTEESRGVGFNPTPVNPEVATNQGREMVDIGKGMEGLGESLQKLQDRRDTLKAEIYLSKAHEENRKLAYAYPDIDTAEERISERSTQNIQEASKFITNPTIRDTFTQKATLDIERRNVPLINTIYRRQSQDVKALLHQANDEDIKEYQELADPAEREMVRNKIIDRTNQTIADGHVNPIVGKKHLETMLKQMDIDQIKNDMALDAENTYAQLQKGDEGIYQHVSPSIRKQYADQSQKQMAKQGAENNHIYSIAQNHAENQMIDMLGKGSLTQEDINVAQLTGINGIKPRPEFIKAAEDAINDPFPTSPSAEKYNKLVDMITSPDTDAIKAKVSVLSARGVTPSQKAHLLNAALREDPTEGKQSINNLIQSGVQQNKQAIMEANNKLNKEIEDRKSFFRGVTGMFRDHAKDDQHLADLQQDYFNAVQNAKDQQEMMSKANQIINRDTIVRNPTISTAEEKGTIFMDRTTGIKRRYFPDGSWTTVK